MSEKSFNDFDKMFREEANREQIHFNPKAWAKMETLLEKEMPLKSNYRNLFVWLAAALFICVFGYVLLYKPNNKIVEVSQLTNNHKSKINELPSNSENNKLENEDFKQFEKSEKKLNENKVNADKNSFNINANSAIKLKDNENRNSPRLITTKDKSSDYNPLKYEKISKLKSESKIKKLLTDNTIGKEILTLENSNNGIIQNIDEPNNKQKIINQNTLEVPETIIATINKNINSKTEVANYSSSQMHNKFKSNFKILEQKAKLNLIPDLTEYETQNLPLLPIYHQPQKKYYLYTALSFGNNLSFVNNPQLNNTKFFGNLLVGYNLNSQVSFQTGVTYRTGTFDALRNEFVYNGPVSTAKNINKVVVDYTTLEIPIEIKYQFNEVPDKGIFLTAGVRKLIYIKDNNTLILRKWNGEVEQKEWNFEKSQSDMSMFSFSIGYQYSFCKNVVFTAQQFVNYPLNKFGGASTRPASLALAVGCRYNFLKKK